MRILIIEDQKKLALSLKKGLEEQSYAVDVAYDGVEGLEFTESVAYDCIILDVLLPKMDGLEVLKKIRDSSSHMPVLILSAKGSLEDRVRGLDLGGDDYLVKPFSFTELLARIRAIHRRKSGAPQNILKIDDLTMNLATREVIRGGQKIDLRPKEFAILQHLMENKGRVMTRSVMMEHIWDYSAITGSNVIDVHIKRLREKIDSDFERKLIKTIKGVGYSIDQ